MFLNSFFSGIKKGSSILGLATTVTSATVGSVTAYYLFKGGDIKSELDELNSKLKEKQRFFMLAKGEIQRKGYEERMEYGRKEVALKQITGCIKDEMKKHDTDWGYFSSNHVPNIEKCKNAKIRT